MPYLIMALACAIAGALVFFLPETKDKPLIDSVEGELRKKGRVSCPACIIMV